VAASVIVVMANPAWAQTSRAGTGAISSARLRRLQRAVAQGDTHALSAFWEAIRRDGAPLIEPTSTDQERLVTFLWQSRVAVNVVVLADFGDYVPHMTLERLPATDVWYRSLRLPSDARFLYELSVDDPAYPFVNGQTVQYPSAPRPDPLNPRRYDFASPHIMSLAELPAAPSLELSNVSPTVPHGVVEQFGQKLASKILGNERDVFVYKPPEYSDSGEPYPLLIVGASYINQIRLPAILDNLIARRRIPPVVAIFVGFPPSGPGQNVQDEESGGGDAFGDFVAIELLPWVRERVKVTTDPRHVVIGGASAGGHSAAFVAWQHPEAIGNVLAQSGAFWRGRGHTANYWGDPVHDDGREGFARAAASRPGPAAPVRFYLTVGRLERGRAFDGDLVSMLHASRHVRDVLQAKGYEVTLYESNGGHDPYNWEAALPEALVSLFGSPPGTTKPK
jgi:enterochelin esterase-like enzyme